VSCSTTRSESYLHSHTSYALLEPACTGDSTIHRAVGIRRAEAERAVGRKAACLVAETVQATELEPRICWTGVLDRFVDGEEIVQIVVVERVSSEVVAIAKICRRNRAEIIDYRIVLESQCECPVLVAPQADIGRATENRVRLIQAAVVDIEAAFAEPLG
jgi:hypothetical protein